MAIELSYQKKDLYNEVPPLRLYDTSVESVFTSRVVANKLKFTRVSFHGMKGGLEYSLLQFVDCGNFLCLADVVCKEEFDERTEKHAFVYNSDYRDNKAIGHVGALIDNRKYSKLRLIDFEDRATIKAARYVFTDFFVGVTRLTKVYHVTKI